MELNLRRSRGGFQVYSLGTTCEGELKLPPIYHSLSGGCPVLNNLSLFKLSLLAQEGGGKG